MRVLAQRSKDILLVGEDPKGDGVIYNRATDRVGPSRPVQSILARGYWNPPTGSAAEQQQVVQRVVQQAKLAERFEIVAPARQLTTKTVEENYTVYPRPGAPKLTKRDSGYVARGPFGCENCRWYVDGGCAVTGTSVEARGCCDLWNEESAPKGIGKERAEYIFTPDSDYTCIECKVYDPSIKMCDYVLGTIAPEASCDKFQPDEKPEAKAYDPNQPRDEQGRFAATGADGGGGNTNPRMPSGGLLNLHGGPPYYIPPPEAMAALQSIDPTWSHAQMHAALQAVLPNRNTSVDMDAFIRKEIAPAVAAFGRVAQDYPVAGVGLDHVGAPKGLAEKDFLRTHPKAMAITSEPYGGHSRVAFAQGYRPGDARGANTDERIGAANGFSFPESATPGSTAVHEFGHVIQNAIERGRDVTPTQRQAFTKFFKSLPMGPKQMATLSRYGTNNRDEAFAEGFAAYYLGSEHPIAQKTGAMLKEVFGSAPRLKDHQ